MKTTTIVPAQVGLASITAGAAFLSLSRNKVYLDIQNGLIPSKRFGKSVRIPWTWLLAQAACDVDGEVAR